MHWHVGPSWASTLCNWSLLLYKIAVLNEPTAFADTKPAENLPGAYSALTTTMLLQCLHCHSVCMGRSKFKVVWLTALFQNYRSHYTYCLSPYLTSQQLLLCSLSLNTAIIKLNCHFNSNTFTNFAFHAYDYMGGDPPVQTMGKYTAEPTRQNKIKYRIYNLPSMYRITINIYCTLNSRQWYCLLTLSYC